MVTPRSKMATNTNKPQLRSYYDMENNVEYVNLVPYLDNSLQEYQGETGLGARSDVPVEHIWARIRRVQSARDKLLLLRRRLAADGTVSLAEK